MTRKPLILPDSAHLKNITGDGRLEAPSATRNYAPILEKLGPHVPDRGVALEIASGTGQHIAALAEAFAQVIWQPSDISADRLESIRAWGKAAALENLAAPIALDATGDWAHAPQGVGLIYVVNLFHLIGEEEAIRVVHGMAKTLGPEGRAFIYGPFTEAGKYRSGGDEVFDRNLRAQDALIGYKDIEWMWQQLEHAGLSKLHSYDMPANNLALVAQKPAD